MKSFAITSVPEEDGYAMYHTTVEATTPAAAVAKFYRLYGNKLTTEPVVATLEVDTEVHDPSIVIIRCGY